MIVRPVIFLITLGTPYPEFADMAKHRQKLLIINKWTALKKHSCETLVGAFETLPVEIPCKKARVASLPGPSTVFPSSSGPQLAE